MDLHIITKIDDPLVNLIKDDPVRPNIPLQQRINDYAQIFVLKEGDEVLAMTCVQYLKNIPVSEEELSTLDKSKDIAVFYTIWSYKPKSGAILINKAADYLKDALPEIKAIITLSPKTEMARKFHLSNGATILQENLTSVNYQYYSILNT